MSIDGTAATRRFVVMTWDGRITGGYDGCNNWGFDGDRGAMVSELRGCGPTVQSDAYSTTIQRVRSTSTLRTGSGDELVVSGGGHRLVFRRASPDGATP